MTCKALFVTLKRMIYKETTVDEIVNEFVETFGTKQQYLNGETYYLAKPLSIEKYEMWLTQKLNIFHFQGMVEGRKEQRLRDKQSEERKRKNNARVKIALAIRSGKLKRLPCERCGTTKKVHAHHEDYNEPLDVMWLCSLHHIERHRELKEIKR